MTDSPDPDREWAIQMAAMWKDKISIPWLEFVRKVIEVPLGFSKTELLAFRHVAEREQPALVQLIDAYIQIADRSKLDIKIQRKRTRRKVRKDGP